MHPGDAPNTTLQESSFQPAGAQNPMPSISYDFFAPLGEFGQPRPHYHMMRRLHLMVEEWGSTLASTVKTNPIFVAKTGDTSAVRWVVRTAESGEGFMFVNNYQRLSNLTVKSGVRFRVTWANESRRAVDVPSLSSAPLTIKPATWFVWPLQLPLVQGKAATLVWATAQLLTRVAGDERKTLLLLSETQGIPVELGLSLNGAKLTISGAARAVVENGTTVVRGIAVGTTSSVVVAYPDGSVVEIVVLSSEAADRVFSTTASGKRAVIIAEHEVQVVASRDQILEVRSVHDGGAVTLLVYPPTIHLAYNGGASIPVARAGIFAAYNITTAAAPDLSATITKLADPGPPRVVQHQNGNPHGKAQEPTLAEWGGAAEYSVRLQTPAAGVAADSEVMLSLAYDGDAARVYYSNSTGHARLLTDNWYSGYRGEGQLEVGLSYLEMENLGLLTPGAELRVLILPIKKSTLGTDIWLQPALYPTFRADGIACNLTAAVMWSVKHTSLAVASTPILPPDK